MPKNGFQEMNRRRIELGDECVMAFFDGSYVSCLGAADDELISRAIPLTDIAEAIAFITLGVFSDKFQFPQDVAPGV